MIKIKSVAMLSRSRRKSVEKTISRLSSVDRRLDRLEDSIELKRARGELTPDDYYEFVKLNSEYNRLGDILDANLERRGKRGRQKARARKKGKK